MTDPPPTLIETIDAAPGGMWIETFRRLHFDVLVRARRGAPQPDPASRELREAAKAVLETWPGVEDPEADYAKEAFAALDALRAALAAAPRAEAAPPLDAKSTASNARVSRDQPDLAALLHDMRLYAVHDTSCEFATSSLAAPSSCSCGFDAVLGRYDAFGAGFPLAAGVRVAGDAELDNGAQCDVIAAAMNRHGPIAPSIVRGLREMGYTLTPLAPADAPPPLPPANPSLMGDTEPGR